VNALPKTQSAQRLRKERQSHVEILSFCYFFRRGTIWHLRQEKKKGKRKLFILYFSQFVLSEQSRRAVFTTRGVFSGSATVTYAGTTLRAGGVFSLPLSSAFEIFASAIEEKKMYDRKSKRPALEGHSQKKRRCRSASGPLYRKREFEQRRRLRMRR